MDRTEYDKILLDKIQSEKPDLVLMVGFMRIVSGQFTNAFTGKLLNVHPSLLPAHAGLMDLAVHQSVLDSGDKESGCTIHQVIEAVDSGENLIQLKCAIELGETAESLKAKVQALEAKAWVELVKNWDKYKQ